MRLPTICSIVSDSKDSGTANSGKSYTSHLVTEQLLRIAASQGKKEIKLAEQIKALDHVLQSFGNAGTSSCYSSLLELHFTNSTRGAKLAAAKILPFGLDKSLVNSQAGSKPVFNVFYQLLAGASPAEREELGLQTEASDYLMLNSSSPIALSSSANSSSSQASHRISFEDLRAAFECLGFKKRHVSGVMRILSAILLLGNLTFTAHEVPLSGDTAWIETDSRPALELAAALLGLQADELENNLVTRTTWVKKERISAILNPKDCLRQRDDLSSSLYAVLFAYIIECANAKIFPGEAEIAKIQADGGASILQLDTPGFTSRSAQSNERKRSTLVQSVGQDGFEQFVVNFSQDLVQAWLSNRLLDPQSPDRIRQAEDGLQIPSLELFDKSIGRLELLRGGVFGGRSDKTPGGIIGGLAKHGIDQRKGRADDGFLEQMRDSCRASTSFTAFPLGSGNSPHFGISHWNGQVIYDSTAFVEKDLDMMDADFVGLLKGSEDSLVSRLMAGPSLNVEKHSRDQNVVIAAQVSSSPLRQPSPVVGPSARMGGPAHDLYGSTTARSLTTQINETLSVYLNLLERAKLWPVFCIAPNMAQSPSPALDQHYVKNQLRSLMLPEVLSQLKQTYLADVSRNRLIKLCGYGDAANPDPQAICEAQGWQEREDFFIGTERVWLSQRAWKSLSLLYLESKESGVSRAPTPFDMSSNINSEQQAKLEAARAKAQHIRNQSRLQLDEEGSDNSDDDEDNVAEKPHETVYGELAPDSPSAMQWAGSTMPLPEMDFDKNQYDTHSYSGLDSPSRYSINKDSQQYFGESSYKLNKDLDNRDLDAADQWGTDKNIDAAISSEKPQLNGKEAEIEIVPSSRSRRLWLALVWMITFWIPDFLLLKVGRIKRPDARLAWREKVTLCAFIFLLCGFVLFYIIAFGLLLCPEYNL